MKISIIIPTYNRCDLLKNLITSLENTILDLKDGDKEIIVISNGCTDETVSYVSSLKDPYKILHWDKPLGYTKAVNIGLCVADGDYIVLLNNDLQILEWGKGWWLNSLLDPFEKDPTCGITGVHKQWRGGKSWFLFCMVAIKKELLNTVGLLDLSFNPGMGEDTDYCLRARQKGYTLHQIPFETKEDTGILNFPIWHIGSETIKYEKDYDIILNRNESLLRERYGKGSLFDPELENKNDN